MTPRDLQLPVWVSMCISIPNDAKGCLLKSCTPLNSVHAQIFGLVLDCLNILTCMSIYVSSWHHNPKGKVLGKPQKTHIACDFHVCIALSSMFFLCIPFGTNLYVSTLMVLNFFFKFFWNFIIQNVLYVDPFETLHNFTLSCYAPFLLLFSFSLVHWLWRCHLLSIWIQLINYARVKDWSM